MSEKSTCGGFTHKRNKPCSAEHPCPLEIVKKTKKPAVVEHVHYDKEGNARNVKVHGYPIFDNGGNVVQMIEYILDITARKKSEKALEAERAKLEAYVNSMIDGLCVNDTNATIVEVNEAFVKMFGYKSQKGLVGKTIFENVAEREVLRLTKRFMDTVKKRESRIRNFEMACSRKDGSEFLASFNIRNLWKDGRYVGSISVARDITERKKAEDKLEESEERYRKLFKRQLEAIIIFDPETGEVEDVNQATLEMFGYTKQEILKLAVYDLSAEEEKTRKAVGEAVKRGRVYEPLRYLRKKNGDVFPTEISGDVFTSKGKEKIFTVIRDITERKKSEKKLKETEVKMKSFMEAATDIFCIFDSKLNFLYISEHGIKAFFPPGTNKEDIIGRNVLDVIPNIKETGRYDKYVWMNGRKR